MSIELGRKLFGRYAALATLGVCLSVLSGCSGDGIGNTPNMAMKQSAAVAPWPIWGGLDFSYTEPPLPQAPTTTFGVSSLTQSTNQTVFSGVHTLAAGTEQNYRIAVFLHNDVFYLQPDATASIGTNGTFKVTIPRSVGTADRAFLMLYPSTFNPLSGTNCNATANTCTGQTTSVTKMSLPVDPANVTAFTTAYFPPAVTSTNAQIAGLQSMMSKIVISGGPYGNGQLIRSFRDMDSAFLYDQATAVIAFSLAGDRADAELILNAMAKLQGPSGAWVFSYLTDGEDANPGVDMRIAGSNAWFGMALNAYQKAFSSTRYLTMSTKLHSYLAGQLTNITINGTAQAGIPFAPTNYLPGRSQIFALEHQLDTYATMQQFYALNGGTVYSSASTKLRSMSESLWNGTRFVAGYNSSSNTLDTSEQFLDNYSWSVLALGNTGSKGQNFAGALPGVCNYFNTAGNLYYPTRHVTGIVGFYDVINNGVPSSSPFVWSEGSIGAVMAMQQGAPTMTCQGNTAANILESLRYMVDKLQGMPYATRNTNSDFTSSGSVAGTAWLYFANNGKNPYAHY